MKYFTIILLFILLPFQLISQCGSGTTVILRTQTDVDNFISNYCTDFLGDLEIEDDNDGVENITDLTPLSTLTAIGGYLWIHDNNILANIDGFSSLTSVGSVFLVNSNNGLVNINGLVSITSIGGRLDISSNAVLTNINSMPSLTSIGGGLSIVLNMSLDNINGLSSITSINGDLNIQNNNILTNIDGLSSIASGIGELAIADNPLLTNIDGLSSINSISGSLFIGTNNVLTNLDGLTFLTTINGRMWINGNAALNDISGIANIDAATISFSSTDLLISHNPQLAVCEVQSVCDFIDLAASNVNLSAVIFLNAPGCNSEAEVDAACSPCTAPIFSLTQGTNNCPTEQFYINVNITNLGSASTVNITNNQGVVATNGVSTGTQSIGPFAANTAVQITVADATDGTCNSLLSLTTPAACSPANDDCANATTLNCGANLLSQTTNGATSVTHNTGCSMSNYGVWYTFTGDGMETTVTVSSTGYDVELAIASGTCGALTNVGCKDTAINGDESITFTTVNGTAYYVYVAHYSGSSTATGDFDIARTCNASCGVASFTLSDGTNNCPTATFYVNVNLTNLGTASMVNITNDEGAPAINNVSSVGTYSVGPFAAGLTPIVTISDAADATCNTDDIIAIPGSCPAASCNELMISEYVEGSGNNKYIEIYNPTSAIISLNNYALVKYINGSASNPTVLNLTGHNIGADDVFVIGNPAGGSWAGSPDLFNSSVMTFNGNDPIALRKNGTNIDLVGNIGSSSNFAINVTISRKSTVIIPVATYESTEWTINPQNYFDNLGAHASASCSLLPIVWMNPLKAEKQDDNVLLTWSVAEQLNNKEFIIEYSDNGRMFNQLGIIQGKISATEEINYHFFHKKPFLGDNYYRIKQIDLDGAHSYSNITHLNYKDEHRKIAIYPNPTYSDFTITAVEGSTITQINLYNQVGALAYKHNLLGFSTNKHKIDVSMLAKGIYFIEVEVDGRVQHERLIVE